MAMNEPELSHVVSDLQRLVGSAFSNAWQPARDRVVLGLSGGVQLLLVPRGPNARFHSVPGRGRNPQKPFSFQGALRAHLHGPLTALTQVPGERVVDLHFGEHRVHLRLTGRSGGLWLVRGTEILAAYDGPAPKALPALAPRPPSKHTPRFAPAAAEDWDRAAWRWFTQDERRQREQGLRTETERNLRRLLQRSQRLLQNLEADLERAARAPVLRRQADALSSNLHAIVRGTSQVALPDPYDPEQTLFITLDPSKPPVATMETLYARARRLDRVGDQVIERLAETEEQIGSLQAALDEVPTATGDALDKLAALAPPQKRGAAADITQPWVTWTGPNGERVLVGRNEKGNRRLTFQASKGRDWWLHVRSRPGAHVVIPTAANQSPPLPVLLAAAQVALIHSKVPVGVSADVQYTQIRNVRSIPGEVGRVRVHAEKVLHVTREPAPLVGWSRDP